MELIEFRQKLCKAIESNPLPDGKPYAVSEYADEVIQTGTNNPPLANIILFLKAHNCVITIEDILCQNYKIESVKDAHKTIERLLDIYKCKITPMNKAIGTIYTPATDEKTGSLSLKTFLAIMDYFNCNITINGTLR